MTDRPDEVPPVTTPVAPEVLRTPDEGLHPGTHEHKDIVVIGAGLAGLVAGFELKREGHHVTVLEAQNRVGGRIYTLHAPFALYHARIQGALESGIRAARQIHEAPGD